MLHKHIRQTKRLASLRQDIVAWQDAIFSAEWALKFAESKDSERKRIARELSYNAFVAFGRPFTSNKGLSATTLPRNLDLLNIRHEICAHTDALKHAYLGGVLIKGGKVVRNEVPTTHLIPHLRKLLKECTMLTEAVAIEINALEDQIDGLKLPDGEYNT